MTRLTIGLSTCPNDTFLFAPLLEGQVDRRGLDIDFLLADVQVLNEALAAGDLGVSKASFATALRLSDRYGVLRVGSALGFGVGPVLLGPPPALATAGAVRPLTKVLCPGEGTTATLLMRCLHPEQEGLEQRTFSEIVPALLRGEAPAGVCIHEARFTYASLGLTLLEDLGASWEERTGLPVPLGGLLARHDLGADVHASLNGMLSESLARARARPEATMPLMRKHAQELDEDVIWEHVRTYVTEHTADFGTVGRRALEELAQRSGVGSAPALLA